ncbi:MAG: hypothetical protein Q9187_003591 [Circinaria calcarea]
MDRRSQNRTRMKSRSPSHTKTPHKRQSHFQQDLFPSYLRAFYPFHPTCDETTSTVTLPLERGDIVLVHSVHTNGWADGTLLSSGARGWLPTNYCEVYDEEAIHVLMKALTKFWDMVKGGSKGNLAIFGNQDFLRGLVAGVRCLLEKASCLTRDSAIIQLHSSLRQNRKGLLSDLSAIVKVSRQLQASMDENPSYELVDGMVDDMVSKAFRMVIRAVRFVDIWNESFGLEESIEASIAALDDCRNAATALPATSADQANPGETASLNVPVDAENDATATCLDPSSNKVHPVGSRDEANSRPCHSRSSQSHVRPGSIPSELPCVQIASSKIHRQSIAHRISTSAQSRTVPPGCLVSERLSEAHENFLALLSNFVGPHLQSRSSNDLLHSVQQAVDSCRILLSIIEAVWKWDLRRSELLEQSCRTMYGSLTDLLQAARGALQFTQADAKDALDTTCLEETVTACVRSAGDCVAKTRFVVEKIGDFEFETTGLGISPFADGDFGFLMEPSGDGSEVKEFNHTTTALSVQPERSDKSVLPPLGSSQGSLPTDLTDLDISPTSHVPKDFAECPVSARSKPLVHSMLPTSPHSISPLVSSVMSHTGKSPSSQTSFSNGSGSANEDFEASRVDSIGVSSTYIGSKRDSDRSIVSPTSTRATSPDMLCLQPYGNSSVPHSIRSSQSTLEECETNEATVLEKTFAHELVHNKDGQITGGTLPALIERLTTYDSTPDALFVSTFYLTFRLFATPSDFAQALIDRFEYVDGSPHIAGPVRLRVYNVFKGWLESHWRSECDALALQLILPFTEHRLSAALPTAGRRLAELAEKVSNASGPLVPRLVSSMGKTNTSLSQYVAPDAPLPPSVISKSQLTVLRNWKKTGAAVSFLDFDPLELARQLTIKESRIFCSILPEELLASEWTKKSASMAVNVRAMSTISTDLANLVVDCILQMEDTGKRAKLIKHWVKVANKCLELNNYDSLMAIICSLNSTTITRLKRTWDMVSVKTKSTLENLKCIVEVSRNYAILRQRLQNHVPPCLPFVGMYLTDLTFVDNGNHNTRQLVGEGGEESVSVINFDKHMKTARIISELQRFQIPYRLTEVPELQTWMQDQLVRVRSTDPSAYQVYYRRSLYLEPRESNSVKSGIFEPLPSRFSGKDGGKEKFDVFNLVWPHATKEKTGAS